MCIRLIAGIVLAACMATATPALAQVTTRPVQKTAPVVVAPVKPATKPSDPVAPAVTPKLTAPVTVAPNAALPAGTPPPGAPPKLPAPQEVPKDLVVRPNC